MTNIEPVDQAPDTGPTDVDPLAPDADAPYGYMIDADTGERRAKKRPGRQKVPAAPALPPFSSPSLEDLKAAQPAAPPREDRSPDEAPRPHGKRRRMGERKGKEPPPVPPFRAGPIASGINKLYSRAGKLVRAMDYDIGVAIIGVTKKESEDDVTIGEAWEEVAKVNPRIRAFLLRMIEGGAWQQLFMAHAPILLAILMKDGIRKRIPFMKFIGSLLDDDDDGPSEVSQALGGLQAGDINQMMNAAAGMMANMGFGVPRSGMPRDPSQDVPFPGMPAES